MNKTTAVIYKLVNACIFNICDPLMGAVRSKGMRKRPRQLYWKTVS